MSAETDLPTTAPAPDGGRAILRVAVAAYGVVCVFALGFAAVRGELGILFGEAPVQPAGLLAGLGIGVALVVLTRVGVRAWTPMRRYRDALVDLIGPLKWPYAVLLALVSGFAEELLFRGALWSTLGLLGTTILFGIVHVPPRRALWIFPLFALATGFLLGLLRLGTESLWPPVVTHATVNALNLGWLGSEARRRLRREED